MAASIGNVVEWFDWYTYSFLTVYFADQIFPKSGTNSLVPVLSAFAVFAVGFFLRPIGGLLLGWVADRIGRRGALTVTIVMMGAGRLLMAVLPTYASAGLAAPALLVFARLLHACAHRGSASRTRSRSPSSGARRPSSRPGWPRSAGRGSSPGTWRRWRCSG
jgi:MHS family alpha-ketoglutarate permease-like MFS transporter